MFQRLDHDLIWKNMPRDGSVQFENLTNSMGVLVIAGPKSRQLMERVAGCDMSNEKFKWLTAKDSTVGLAPARLMRVNFVGELGWEIHHGIEYQNHIFDALMEAGKDLGLKPFGIRAMDSLRIEKSYRMVGTEMSIEYAAYESGLDRFIRMDKEDFHGREGLAAWQEKGFANAFATLVVDGPDDSDAIGNNPIMKDGEVVGRATGGNYGFRLEKSIAFAILKKGYEEVGTELEIDILGNRYPCRVVEESPYDPKNEKLRA
jgi:dimethylglycine dehydrogenase